MEGPSLYLAARQLAPFKGQVINRAFGNTKLVPFERLGAQKIKDIFSWGKNLVFQFDSFALRVHFLMFGTFAATVDEKSVTGDYKRKAREPRLAFELKNGHIEMYSCSVRLFEGARFKKTYDYSVDLMSKQWDPTAALKKMRKYPNHQIGDVLLDQTIFAGLGNIIKNEILYLARVRPITLVRDISKSKQRELVELARSFCFQFYRWRKKFILKKNLKIYRKQKCPICGKTILRAKTGIRRRWSYYCPDDQK